MNNDSCEYLKQNTQLFGILHQFQQPFSVADSNDDSTTAYLIKIQKYIY